MLLLRAFAFGLVLQRRAMDTRWTRTCGRRSGAIGGIKQLVTGLPRAVVVHPNQQRRILSGGSCGGSRCSTASATAWDDEEDCEEERTTSQSWLPTIARKLRDTHDPEVAKTALDELRDFFDYEEQGEELLDNRVPQAIVMAMERFDNDADVQIDACEFLRSAMTSCEAYVDGAIVDANGHLIILAALKRHSANYWAAHNACKALRILLEYIDSTAKLQIVREGAISALSSAIRRNLENSSLRYSAFGLIEELSAVVVDDLRDRTDL